jgi:hypothetical protein
MDSRNCLNFAASGAQPGGLSLQARDGSEAVRKYTEARESEKPFDAVMLDLTDK